MRVNFGCGEFYADGWTNVDLPTTPHRHDLDADLRLPLPDAFADLEAVYIGHCLEHLTPADGTALLRRILERCVTGARICCVQPDVPLAEQMYPEGHEQLRLIRDGGHRWEGDAHLWHTSSAGVAELLVNAGWSDVVEYAPVDIPRDWPVTAYVGWQSGAGAVAP